MHRIDIASAKDVSQAEHVEIWLVNPEDITIFFKTFRQVRGDKFLAKDVGNLVMVKEVILGELVK